MLAAKFLQNAHTVNIFTQASRPFCSNWSATVPKQCTRAFRSFTVKNGPVRGRFGRSQFGSRDGDRSSAVDSNRLIVAAGAALGVGGLCLYGIFATPSSSLSAFDRASAWPDYVRQRIHATYGYLAGGTFIAASSAIAMSRSHALNRLMLSSGWMAPILMTVACMGSGIVCQMIPYPRDGGLSVKHLAWVAYSTSLGALLMPLSLVGGPILTQAALYTGGIVGGLSLVAATSPSDRFLKWGGPLAIGLGVVFVSSLGSMFLSPASRLGYGMGAISLYGGLLLFSGFLLYDTQMVVKRAESHPRPSTSHPSRITDYELKPQFMDQIRPYDPINNSIHILMDMVNIFVRVVTILSGGGQRRK